MVRSYPILGFNIPFKYRNVHLVPFTIEFNILIVRNGPIQPEISTLITLTATVIFLASRIDKLK